MILDGLWKATESVIREYVRMAKVELSERWKNWPEDLSCCEFYEVVGALTSKAGYSRNPSRVGTKSLE